MTNNMKLLKYTLIAGATLIFSKQANGTFQREDKLIYETSLTTISPIFLEEYFNTGIPKPELLEEEGTQSTGCYRKKPTLFG